MSIGISLRMSDARPTTGAAPTPPVSAITTMEIVGTPLLDATNDYGDATVRIGVDGAGWVVKVTLPYLVGQTFDPTKITFTITDPGYDATTTTTVTRACVGGTILRRQYNAAANLQQANDGVTLTVYFSLSQPVFAGSTITLGGAATGFYGSSTPGTVAITNSSTLAYLKPMGFAWLTPDYVRATGALDVECVAFHHFARNGRQVARIEFIGTDNSAHTAATQTVSAPALSTRQTKGNICESWKAQIPVTALTQADACLVNAKVYPWIGDSSAILDVAVDGQSTAGDRTHACPVTPLRFLNDKSGTYGGGHAAVQVGAVGGTVQATYALALTTPFPTVGTAVIALPAWNTANKTGNVSHSGSTVWLMETTPGAGASHTLGSSTSAVVAGKCWTEIKVDPAASGAVALGLATATQTADLLRHYENINHSASNGLDGGSNNANKRVAFENMTMTVSGTASAPTNFRFGLSYLSNVSFSGLTGTSFPWINATPRTQAVLLFGCENDATCSNGGGAYFAAIGNTFVTSASAGDKSSANFDIQDGMVLYNNKFFKCGSAAIGNLLDYNTYGATLVQNIFERSGGTVGQPNMSLSEQPFGMKVLMQHNTMPGVDTSSRWNMLYTDDNGSQSLKKEAYRRYNLIDDFNSKSDRFVTNSTQTGRNGQWRMHYGVLVEGDVICNGANDGGYVTPSNGATDNWLGNYYPPVNDITPKAGRANVTFTNMQGGVSNSGNGVYTLTGVTNAAYAHVPAGMSALGFDIAAAARRTDGSGAVGAYERTV